MSVRILAAAGLAASLIAAPAVTPALAQDAPLTATQRTEVEQIVRDYLLANPEVVYEALTVLQQREEMAAAERQREMVVAFRDQLEESPHSPIMGNPDGDVTLVEFFDYQCGYCKRMLDRVFQVAEDDGNLRIVFKEFPILGPQSTAAARAALASREQGLYLEFHNALMGFQGQLSDDVIFGLAREVGLDVGRLQADMESEAVSAEIAANLELARALDIRGTPAFVIGDNVVPGAVGLGVLQDMIEDVRSGSS